MDKITLKTEKIKKVVELLEKELDFINGQDFFNKYQQELKNVDITSVKSVIGCLSSTTIKSLIEKRQTYNNINKTHYKLITNFKDYLN